MESGYVVTRGGTFGRVVRSWVGEAGWVSLIKWGPLGWLTPVASEDVHYLRSAYESEARREAEEWLRSDVSNRTQEDEPR